jgi:hypothetical protein
LAFSEPEGTVSRLPQCLHLTVLPRAEVGTVSTERHFKLGHIRRMLSEVLIGQLLGHALGLRRAASAWVQGPLPR